MFCGHQMGVCIPTVIIKEFPRPPMTSSVTSRTVFWSDWLDGGSIGAEWLNRGRGTVSHSFHLESIFDPDPPQPSGTCNHPPSNNNKKHIDDYNNTNYNCDNNKHLEGIFFLLLLSQNIQYNLKFELNRFAAFFHIFPYCLIICGSSSS